MSTFRLWQYLLLLGTVLMLHGVILAGLAVTPAKNPIWIPLLLTSVGLQTVILSFLMRTWSGARAMFIAGALRIAAALGLVVASIGNSGDYRQLLVTMMVAVAGLEFIISIRLRRAEEPYVALRASALIGVLASACLIGIDYTWDFATVGVLVGLSMVFSGIAVISLGLFCRKMVVATDIGLRSIMIGGD